MTIESPSQTLSAEAIIIDLAHKMVNPLKVKAIVLESTNKNPAIDQFPWSDCSLSHGFPALVSFYAHLDAHFPDQKWDLAAHEYVLQIAASIESDGIHDYSLFGGLSGICWALLQASKNKTRYQKLLQTLNKELVEAVNNYYLLPMKEDVQKKIPSGVQLYDLIQGIVGIGSYMLQDMHHPLFYETLISVTHTLIERCRLIDVEGYRVPGWYVPNSFQFTEQDIQLFPKGNFNLGLAHGVPGILSFLAIAYAQGICLDHQVETMQYIAEWLINKNCGDKNAPRWRDRVSFEEETGNIPSKATMHRDAWCYGTPGVARSLYLAGQALNDHSLKQFATQAFKMIFHRSEDEWGLISPTFCHGIVGLLAVTHRMAQDTDDPILIAQTVHLKQKLINSFDTALPFGFQDLEPLTFQKGALKLDYMGVNKAGLLEGAAGIGLGLLGISRNNAVWDTPFLINGGTP